MWLFVAFVKTFTFGLVVQKDKMVRKGHAKFLSSFVLNVPWKNDDGAVIRALNITTPEPKIGV